VASWDGKWVVKVGPISTGKPFDIQVAGPQTVHFHAVSQPSATTPAHWSVCTPITVVEQGSGGGFTAAGYSFTGISLGIRSNMDQRCACRRGLGALEAARVQCAAGSS